LLGRLTTRVLGRQTLNRDKKRNILNKSKNKNKKENKDLNRNRVCGLCGMISLRKNTKSIDLVLATVNAYLVTIILHYKMLDSIRVPKNHDVNVFVHNDAVKWR